LSRWPRRGEPLAANNRTKDTGIFNPFKKDKRRDKDKTFLLNHLGQNVPYWLEMANVD